MWTSREDMATTSLEEVREREWGFAGRVMVLCVAEGLLRSWKWRVESQEEDIRRAKVLVIIYVMGGIKLTVLFAVDYRLNWRAMRAHDCLLSCLKIDSMNLASEYQFHVKGV